MGLAAHYQRELLEAGCDEAGRGCLAGPVYAAAVVLPADFSHPLLNDSKKLSARQRDLLREVIEQEATAWTVAAIAPEVIDQINILQASWEAMHQAIGQLSIRPELLLIDGNRFRPYPDIPHVCMVKGDGRFASIAAASILAKTHRDAYMEQIAQDFPHYDWNQNKGYPTRKHREAILQHGLSPHHRLSFRQSPLPVQGSFFD